MEVGSGSAPWTRALAWTRSGLAQAWTRFRGLAALDRHTSEAPIESDPLPSHPRALLSAS
jgi:hypothetical protein